MQPPDPELPDTLAAPLQAQLDLATRSAPAEDDLATAATCSAPSGDLGFRGGGGAPRPLVEGDRLDDFLLLRVLGKGSFATVFLARQESLDRLVALKVTDNQGSEARTLASLEHDSIVHVFSESVEPRRNLRLLCMQFVPGTTLERLITCLRGADLAGPGRAFLDPLDALSQGRDAAAFHPAALRDRDRLAEGDLLQALCWLGTRLAEALDYAHRQGILHRDVKPANILVTPYGRPLLADFNLALNTRPLAGASQFGGTLAYMAPEHLDAFNPLGGASPDVVDRRSDIYSLGVVLFELLTGKRPFGGSRDQDGVVNALRSMAAERRAGAPSPRAANPAVSEVLDQVIRRCLDPDPGRRYPTGEELASALDGARDQRRVGRALPPLNRFAEPASRRPFLAFVVLGFLPHVLGSLVNTSYNLLLIVEELTTDRQKAVFKGFVLVYNLVVYPICLYLVIRSLRPVLGAWRGLARGRDPGREALASARRQALRLPAWVVGLSCLGWLPGGLLFPVVISLLAEPLGPKEFGHFLTSFTVSGLIALTYSYFAAQFVSLRLLYPRLWADPGGFRAASAGELCRGGPRLGLFQALAGVIPLAGAVVMVAGGPEVIGDRWFRLLVTALILLGMAGFCLALTVARYLEDTLAALTGSRSPGPPAQST